MVKEAKETATKVFENEEFSFAYPATWKEVNVDVPVIRIALVDSNSTGSFAENLNVTSEPSSATPAEAAEDTSIALSTGQGGEVIQDYQQLDYIDYPEYNAGLLSGTYTHADQNTKILLAQYFVSTGETLYALNISYSEDSYNRGVEHLQAIIDSFQIKNPVNITNTNSAESSPFTEQNLFAEMMSHIVTEVVGDESIHEKTYNYILDHYELFPAVSEETYLASKQKVDSNVTSRQLLKNLNPYLNQMIEVSGVVIDITEEEIRQGIIVTEIHIVDDYDNSYVGFYAGATGDIYEEDFVTIRGVPTSLYYFDNISGGTTISILLGVSTIEIIE
ncbi:hypothetical protein JCM10914_345 [Paenibacillus sp. JCM 10914]|nr:hypothetical protein JCM10914_345 [Paenibacillus sp. JCM 10914]